MGCLTVTGTKVTGLANLTCLRDLIDRYCAGERRPRGGPYRCYCAGNRGASIDPYCHNRTRLKIDGTSGVVGPYPKQLLAYDGQNVVEDEGREVFVLGQSMQEDGKNWGRESG